MDFLNLNEVSEKVLETQKKSETYKVILELQERQIKNFHNDNNLQGVGMNNQLENIRYTPCKFKNQTETRSINNVQIKDPP